MTKHSANKTNLLGLTHTQTPFLTGEGEERKKRTPVYDPNSIYFYSNVIKMWAGTEFHTKSN